MKIERMDLGDVGSPEGLVRHILKLVPNLPIPVPIEELAHQLDIEEIVDLTTEGYEGGLITDVTRSSGTILVSAAARKGRRRFTVGHELGHFLIPTHKPAKAGQFLCSRDDMRQWSTKELTGYARMEAEANRFSAMMLMPPPIMRKYIERFKDPDLVNIIDLAIHFDVSKEPAARAYAEYNEQPIAIAVVKDAQVLRIYRNSKFPHMYVQQGQRVPQKSLYYLAKKSVNPTSLQENGAELWVTSDWGKRLPTLYEQVFRQQEDFALLLLWTESASDDEDDDSEENMTSSERLRRRQNNRFR